MFNPKKCKDTRVLHELFELPEKILFFGYGSLMSGDGINGRGLYKLFADKDVTPATVKNLKRGLTAEYAGVHYYGTYPKKGATTLGVVFEVDYADLIALLFNEYAYPLIPYYSDPMYGILDVTDSIDIDTKGLPVLALINQPAGENILLKNKLKDKRTLAYVTYCYEACQHLGEAFVENFLKTGGVKPHLTTKF